METNFIWRKRYIFPDNYGIEVIYCAVHCFVESVHQKVLEEPEQLC